MVNAASTIQNKDLSQDFGKVAVLMGGWSAARPWAPGLIASNARRVW